MGITLSSRFILLATHYVPAIMSRFLPAAAALVLFVLSLYTAQKSYVAIIGLRKYEERSERAAKHSETAARELHKSRATQASSAAAVRLPRPYLVLSWY